MEEEIREMLAKLKFSNEVARKIFKINEQSIGMTSYEAWAVGKLMMKEKVNKEVMYKVLRSLCFTNEWVNFVEVDVEYFLVKFGTVKDHARILNLAPWFFDQHILALMSYVKD